MGQVETCLQGTEASSSSTNDEALRLLSLAVPQSPPRCPSMALRLQVALKQSRPAPPWKRLQLRQRHHHQIHYFDAPSQFQRLEHIWRCSVRFWLYLHSNGARRTCVQNSLELLQRSGSPPPQPSLSVGHSLSSAASNKHLALLARAVSQPQQHMPPSPLSLPADVGATLWQADPLRGLGTCGQLRAALLAWKRPAVSMHRTPPGASRNARRAAPPGGQARRAQMLSQQAVVRGPASTWLAPSHPLARPGQKQLQRWRHWTYTCCSARR
mmetsp:Transcript_34199/g.60496  ORF Transcript_34199/g.60496 Transcript_34199/m.60496 type:complete len:269 (+) Transcript_34199:73-879(+)